VRVSSTFTRVAQIMYTAPVILTCVQLVSPLDELVKSFTSLALLLITLIGNALRVDRRGDLRNRATSSATF